MNDKPTWKNTLNSRLAGGLWSLDGFLEVALKAGYPYVEWNDLVYRTAGFNLNEAIMPARDLDQAAPRAEPTAGRAGIGEALVRLVRLLSDCGEWYETLACNARNTRGVATLPREELTEALSQRSARRAHLAVAAAVAPDGLTVVFGDLSAATVPLSAFRPNGAASPDFGRLELADHGNTIRLGEYEASARSVRRDAAARIMAGG